MMDEKEIMPYNFFKYGGVYTGEHHGMRYLIKNGTGLVRTVCFDSSSG